MHHILPHWSISKTYVQPGYFCVSPFTFCIVLPISPYPSSPNLVFARKSLALSLFILPEISGCSPDLTKVPIFRKSPVKFISSLLVTFQLHTVSTLVHVLLLDIFLNTSVVVLSLRGQLFSRVILGSRASRPLRLPCVEETMEFIRELLRCCPDGKSSIM